MKDQETEAQTGSQEGDPLTDDFTSPDKPEEYGVDPDRPGLGKKAVIATVIVIGLILVGIGVYAAFRAMPTQLEPEDIFASMQEKMVEVEQVSYEGTMSIVGEAKRTDGGVDVAINIEGAVDASEQDSVHSDTDITLDVEGRSPNLTANVGLGIISIGDELFVRPHTMSFGEPSDMLTAMASGFAQSVKEQLGDRWIAFSASSTRSVSAAPNLEAEEAERASELFLETLRNELTLEDLLTMEEELEDETVAGVESYQYRVRLNVDELLDAFMVAYETLRDEGIVSETEFSQMKSQFDSARQEAGDALKELGARVWIGKEEFYLRKVVIDDITTENRQAKFTFAGEVTFPAYGEEVTIDRPQSVVTIEDFVEEFEFSGLAPQGSAGQ